MSECHVIMYGIDITCTLTCTRERRDPFLGGGRGCDHHAEPVGVCCRQRGLERERGTRLLRVRLDDKEFSVLGVFYLIR